MWSRHSDIAILHRVTSNCIWSSTVLPTLANIKGLIIGAFLRRFSKCLLTEMLVSRSRGLLSPRIFVYKSNASYLREQF